MASLYGKTQLGCPDHTIAGMPIHRQRCSVFLVVYHLLIKVMSTVAFFSNNIYPQKIGVL